MSTLEFALWALGLAAIGAVVLVVLWSLWPVPRARLMRCPGSGAIAFVRIEEVRLPGKTEPEPRVTYCDHWPLRKPCNRGCLARYHETNVKALRPFEHS
jgi:hypothetical protein